MNIGTVRISPDGTIFGVYDDEVYRVVRDKEFGGQTRIYRASHVEFDNDAQAWFVDMLEHQLLGIATFRVGPFPERNKALSWESNYLNSRLRGLSDAEARERA